MIGEVWTYISLKPNNGFLKVRPVLVVGNDANNELHYVDIHYAIISSSSDCGLYDVTLDDQTANKIGLEKASIIKTTKLYTGPRSKLGVKIGELPENKKQEFILKYQKYQEILVAKFVHHE